MFLRSHYASLTLLALAFGCASNPPPTAETPAESPVSAPAVATESSAAAAPAAAALGTIATFEAAKGGLPEGLAVQGAFAYVGLAPTGQIMRVALADGTVSPYAALPTPAANKGFMTGMEFDASGQLYVALASFVDKPQAGIYRVLADGSQTSLFAAHERMSFPNGIALADKGELFVTDSGTGAVFRVSAAGKATPWSTSELLKGDKDYCGKGVGASFDIGANGIARIGNTVYVANNDRATIVRIPISADGSAGTPSALAGPDCAMLGGADGLVADTAGNLVVATNRLNRIIRVSPSGKLETLAEGSAFDFPASVSIQGSELFATNFALANAMGGKPARPGLLKLRYAL